MRINDLIEGISPVVYHLTSLIGAGQIVSQNRFRLSASFSNDSEQETGSRGLYFLSTTRSKTGGYTMRTAGNQSVVLKLDGRALAQRYSGEPVQYWTRSMIQIDPRYDELEDRVYHDAPFLPDAVQYIDEAHVLITTGLSVPGRRGLVSLKKAGIPTWMYDDENAFIVQNKSKAKPLKDFALPKAEPAQRYPIYNRRASDKQDARRNRRRGELTKLPYGIDRWVMLMTMPTSRYDSLHHSIKDYLQRLEWDQQAKTILSSDLHSAKNNPAENTSIGQLMRKHKLRTPSDIINFIVKRWQPVIND